MKKLHLFAIVFTLLIVPTCSAADKPVNPAMGSLKNWPVPALAGITALGVACIRARGFFIKPMFLVPLGILAVAKAGGELLNHPESVKYLDEAKQCADGFLNIATAKIKKGFVELKKRAKASALSPQQTPAETAANAAESSGAAQPAQLRPNQSRGSEIHGGLTPSSK